MKRDDKPYEVVITQVYEVRAKSESEAIDKACRLNENQAGCLSFSFQAEQLLEEWEM